MSDRRTGSLGCWIFDSAGRISRLIQAGFATGKVGEVLLVPGKPKLPFDKILLSGIGKRSEFNDPVFRTVLNKILRTLEGLRAHRRGGAARSALRRHLARARRRHLARIDRRSKRTRCVDADRARRSATRDHSAHDSRASARAARVARAGLRSFSQRYGDPWERRRKESALLRSANKLRIV